jgi:type II secretory pathway component PulJ
MLSRSAWRQAPGRFVRQRGLSLVELMVGIALGLFVVAGASLVVSTQLGENRRMLLETQIHQDLRATADIITRELRRAGTVRDLAALQRVWFAGGPPPAAQTGGAVIVSGGVDTAEVCYSYHRIAGADNQPLGYRHVAATGTLGGGIQSRLAAGGWQDLTDRNTLNVTAFRVQQNVSAELVAMPSECPPGAAGLAQCVSQLRVRDLLIEIEGEARTDATVRRSVSSRVRLRNDLVVNPGPPGASPCAPAPAP